MLQKPEEHVLPPRSAAPNLEQYKLLMSRRQSFTQMIWQIPVLATGANGVLLTKATETAGTIEGAAVSILAMVISFASLQLLARHRMNERMDTELIRRFEDANSDYARTVGAHGGNNILYWQIFGKRPGIFSRLSSGAVWNSILAFILLCAAAAAAWNIALL